MSNGPYREAEEEIPTRDELLAKVEKFYLNEDILRRQCSKSKRETKIGIAWAIVGGIAIFFGLLFGIPACEAVENVELKTANEAQLQAKAILRSAKAERIRRCEVVTHTVCQLRGYNETRTQGQDQKAPCLWSNAQLQREDCNTDL